jgi:predicted choloylglycine hydrolase
VERFKINKTELDRLGGGTKPILIQIISETKETYQYSHYSIGEVFLYRKQYDNYITGTCLTRKEELTYAIKIGDYKVLDNRIHITDE